MTITYDAPGRIVGRRGARKGGDLDGLVELSAGGEEAEVGLDDGGGGEGVALALEDGLEVGGEDDLGVEREGVEEVHGEGPGLGEGGGPKGEGAEGGLPRLQPLHDEAHEELLLLRVGAVGVEGDGEERRGRLLPQHLLLPKALLQERRHLLDRRRHQSRVALQSHPSSPVAYSG